MKLLVFQAWFLKCKLLAKWFSFQEQQIPSVLLMSCDYNFIEIFNFWETKVCLGFSQKKFISKFRECQSKKLNFSPGFARTWAYFRSTDFPKKISKILLPALYCIGWYKNILEKKNYGGLSAHRKDIRPNFWDSFLHLSNMPN